MSSRTRVAWRWRPTVGWTMALLVYGSVLIAGPFLHHDLACHVKSRAHCTSCAFTASAYGVEGHVTAPLWQPGETERPVMDIEAHLGRETHSRPQDRSPPA